MGYGASRTRTDDLLGAIQALSQLSYSPVRRRMPRGAHQFSLAGACGLAGLGAHPRTGAWARSGREQLDAQLGLRGSGDLGQAVELLGA